MFAAVLGIDAAAKAWAVWALTEPVRIADWLYLMLHRNSGLFLGTVPVSAAYWICVGAALAWFGWRALRSKPSVAERLPGRDPGGRRGQRHRSGTRGTVVDFIGVGPISGDRWLVVNLADLAMVVGALALACFLLRTWRFDRNRPAGARACHPAGFGTAGAQATAVNGKACKFSKT